MKDCVKPKFPSLLLRGKKELRGRHWCSRTQAGFFRGCSPPQHPGIVCRNFVQREGSDEVTFVLSSPYVTFSEEGVGCWGIWASHDSILSAHYSRSSRLFTITFRRWWGLRGVNINKCH